MVFVSVCFVFVTVLSLIPASGTLFPYFLEEFGETRAKTATVLAVFKGVGLCSGEYFPVKIAFQDSQMSDIEDRLFRNKLYQNTLSELFIPLQKDLM